MRSLKAFLKKALKWALKKMYIHLKIHSLMGRLIPLLLKDYHNKIMADVRSELANYGSALQGMHSRLQHHEVRLSHCESCHSFLNSAEPTKVAQHTSLPK